VRFAQTDARVRLGASWTALGRLADLELAHAVELHQEGGAARGPLAALAAHLTCLSLQARAPGALTYPCAGACAAGGTGLGEQAGLALPRAARAAQRVSCTESCAHLARLAPAGARALRATPSRRAVTRAARERCVRRHRAGRFSAPQVADVAELDLGLGGHDPTPNPTPRQVAEVAELDLVSDSLRCASLACGAVAAGRPARCPALAALALERPRLALPHVPGLAALRRLHLGRRCEARARARLPRGRGQPEAGPVGLRRA